MATTVLDKDKVTELLRRYRPSLTNTTAGGGSAALLFTCPFHNDTNPSFTFIFNSSIGVCYSCRKRASLQEIVATLENISDAEATKIVSPCYKSVRQKDIEVKKSTLNVSIAQIKEWNASLQADVRIRSTFTKWGWTREVMDRFLLGSSEGRLTIPMFERDELINLKFYTPGASKNKYSFLEGGTNCCWPLENLQHDVIYLVEGEKDCLTMISAGFNTVTFTTGAGTVPKEYIRFFAGKTVYIIYDIDEPGRKGAVTVAKMLGFATKKIHIVELPLDGVPKGDITDAYLQDPENFVDFINNIVAHTDEFIPPSVTTRVHIPQEMHNTYLEDLVKSKMFYKRVRMKVRVINNAQHEVTLVPKDVEILCNKDFKSHVCNTCPKFFKEEDFNLHIKPEYPELMSMVGNNDRIKRQAIQSMTGLGDGCNKFRVEQHTHQSLYPIVIIPAIEPDKKEHNYSMVTAWALDVASKENVDYCVEAVTLANPETQRMVVLVYKMSEDASSLDNFELNEELIERLKCFQCTNPPLQILPTS